MSLRVLLVDTDVSAGACLREAIGSCVDIETCTNFAAARSQLLRGNYDRLVTNLRLQSHNGLHLVHLASPATRSIVYTERPDISLAREIQNTCAFYECRERLAHAIVGYVQSSLPPVDRRNPSRAGRRMMFRGGRRSSDVFSMDNDVWRGF